MDKKGKSFVRVNEQIKLSPVLVVKNGEQLGILPIEKALRMARDEGKDLVEVAPQARPPVCSIIDYGKYKYDRAKKQQKSNTSQQLKIVQFRPNTDEHDLETKIRSIRKFLSKGNKVQIVVRYGAKRGSRRELAHKDEGQKIIEKVMKGIEDICNLDGNTKMEGRDKLICRVDPKAG